MVLKKINKSCCQVACWGFDASRNGFGARVAFLEQQMEMRV